MQTPVLHVLAGPNGSGKSTFVSEVLQPVTGLAFINADEIARAEWPGEEQHRAYDASRRAADQRQAALEQRSSFITETVFSHDSKLGLVAQACARGYLVELHVMLVPEELAVQRVAYRVQGGGHTVPEQKVRERYHRLWPLIVRARSIAGTATFYDNAGSKPFVVVARYDRGQPVGHASWPAWTPRELTDDS